MSNLEIKPLHGKTILVTRARKQASELVNQLEQLGASVMEFPVIETVPPRDPLPMDKAIQSLEKFDWIIFTSSNGVSFFMDRVAELHRDRLDMWKGKIGVVGPKTAQVLKEYGKIPDLVAENFKAEGLLESLKAVLEGNERILFPRSSIAKPFLAEELTNLGFQITEIDAYDTVQGTDKAEEVVQALNERSIQYITFTSSSTVKNFCDAIQDDQRRFNLRDVGIVCIGPVTAETAKTHHLPVNAVAVEHTITGLIDALLELDRKRV